MTTEATPDPIIAQWSESLEADLTEAGMEQAEAHAYRQSFELGLNRLMSVVATKQELKDGLADLRDQLQREMELRFAEVNRRFDEMETRTDRRFDEMQIGTDQRFDETRAESNGRFDETQAESNRRFDEAQAETNRRFEEAQRRTDQRFAESEKLMMTKFDELDKRIRLLAAATGIGFALVIGFLSALVVLVA
ncbi:MAG: hypothetical protein OXI41_10095 [Chloroflexota bacterium]|nr:hypothetical protein [Chloroflexota bacterium]MDE2894784.1 hypothetical protein [Chloroflexota bacterium]